MEVGGRTSIKNRSGGDRTPVQMSPLAVLWCDTIWFSLGSEEPGEEGGRPSKKGRSRQRHKKSIPVCHRHIFVLNRIARSDMDRSKVMSSRRMTLSMARRTLRSEKERGREGERERDPRQTLDNRNPILSPGSRGEGESSQRRRNDNHGHNTGLLQKVWRGRKTGKNDERNEESAASDRARPEGRGET